MPALHTGVEVPTQRSPRRAPRTDYRWVTTDPDRVGVPYTNFMEPLPDLEEPLPLPAVGLAVGDPLVPVHHPRVRSLAVYWHSGWEHAVPETLLRSTVARKVARVAEGLPPRFGLAVLDAWRPLALQQCLFEETFQPAGAGLFVSPPSADPRTPPPHLTGGTVDLTLTWDGHPLALGTPFDEFSDRAFTASFEGIDSPIRELRRMLYWSMRQQGFVVLQSEWWHFEYGTPRWAALTGRSAIFGPASPERERAL